MAQWHFWEYREYWDFPRMVVARDETGTYLFHSPFVDALDDYYDGYHVYRLPELSLDEFKGSWEELEQRALEQLADLPLRSLPFDRPNRTLHHFDTSVLRSGFGSSAPIDVH